MRRRANHALHGPRDVLDEPRAIKTLLRPLRQQRIGSPEDRTRFRLHSGLQFNLPRQYASAPQSRSQHLQPRTRPD